MTLDLGVLQRQCATAHLNFALYAVEGESYPENMVFTPRDMVGRRFANHKGRHMVCSYVEEAAALGEVPNAHFVPDFTKGLAGYEGLSGANWDEHTIHWRNMINNLKHMNLTLDRLPQADTVFCVGSGPALMKNWRELERVKGRPGCAIIGCNELLQYLPAGLLDYYMVLDACSPDRWWEGRDCSRTTAIFGPPVPPSYLKANWQRVLWYKIGLASPFNRRVARKRGNLVPLIPMYGVGPTELQVAWLMKPKTVILVGHSYAYDRINGVIYEHINEPLTPDRWEGQLRAISEFATTDINGAPIVTDYNILITGMATLASCQLLIDAGVRVINATEGGILKSNNSLPAFAKRAVFPERATLASVVGELA